MIAIGYPWRGMKERGWLLTPKWCFWSRSQEEPHLRTGHLPRYEDRAVCVVFASSIKFFHLTAEMSRLKSLYEFDCVCQVPPVSQPPKWPRVLFSPSLRDSSESQSDLV